MLELPCKLCKYFKCAYVKNNSINIMCDKHWFELTFDIDSPFCCGMFKANKKELKRFFGDRK